MKLLSIVIPIYNEEESIPVLLTRLNALIEHLNAQINIEVFFIDDHSTDQTPHLLREICTNMSSYRYIRLAANSGSHIAILAGMAYARGDCAIFLAADLQDPPELIPQMLEKWREGNHIVWAVRYQREGLSWLDRKTSSFFYTLLNRFSKVKFPSQGADFALLDRVAVTALLKSIGPNPILGIEINRLGFKRAEIEYTKAARQFGKSKWSLERKLVAFADAFVSTTYMPLRLMSYLGFLSSGVGFLYALVVIVLRLTVKNPIEGWSALMVVILFIGGIQMMMLGIIGEYLWRTLEQSRKRPLYHIEEQLLPPEQAKNV